MVLWPEYCWDHPWWPGGAGWVPAQEPRGPHAADGPLLRRGKRLTPKNKVSLHHRVKKNTLNVTEEAANASLEICVSDQLHTWFFRGDNVLPWRTARQVTVWSKDTFVLRALAENFLS